ncbi:uncharacterized protein CDAR_112021 [Caerostris darwini]|uniref:DUF7041 domain-containing protein n=1 Tax=Caerostris darwini TaxID=1538125 RepID=A0AAV4QTK0_9ARAC|nr:uncharacterized protein CDAR_112021 [Caerostris darwini]
MTETSESGAQQIARVASSHPQFCRANPNIWFQQMESQFTLAGVTTETTKFHHGVSALQPEELAVVSDIILKPPADVPFTDLKKRLCAQYADSEAQRLRDLIFGMQLGDRRPSKLLLEMRSKILSISNDNLDKLAEMGDGIMSTSSVPVFNAVAASADQPDLRIMSCKISFRLSRLEARTRDQSRGRNQRRSTNRSRQTENPDHCWYHRKFKQRQVQQNVDPHVLT